MSEERDERAPTKGAPTVSLVGAPLVGALVGWWSRWFAIPLSLRVAVGVWVALLLGVFGRVACSRPDQQSVVPIYLLAAERLKANENLYADPPPGMDIYRNPPAVAALFVPFTFLDPTLAAILWRLIGISLYLVGLKRLIRDVLPPLSPVRRAWVWILSAVLVIPAFNNGQINLPIVATTLLGTAAAARGAWKTAAVWLVIAGWFKVYTAAVGLLMSVAYPKLFFSRFFVTGFLIAGATWMGVEMWGSVGQDWEVRREPLTDFIKASQGDDRSAAPQERAPKDWTILARVWFGVAVPKPVSLGVSLAVAVGMAILLFLRGDRREPVTVFAPLALGLLWLTLFGPATEMNTYSVLAPVAATLCVVGVFGVEAWLGTLLLVVAVVRGAFPSDSNWPMHTLQPIGASLLLLAALRSKQQPTLTPPRPEPDLDRPLSLRWEPFPPRPPEELKF